MALCLITMLTQTKFNRSLRPKSWTLRKHPSIRITSNQLNFPPYNIGVILRNWKTLLIRATELILFFLQLVVLMSRCRIVSSRTLTSYFNLIKRSGLKIKMVSLLKCTKNYLNRWWMLFLVNPIPILKFRTLLHFLTISLFKIMTIKNSARIQTKFLIVLAKAYKIFLVIQASSPPDRSW